MRYAVNALAGAVLGVCGVLTVAALIHPYGDAVVGAALIGLVVGGLIGLVGSLVED